MQSPARRPNPWIILVAVLAIPLGFGILSQRQTPVAPLVEASPVTPTPASDAPRVVELLAGLQPDGQAGPWAHATRDGLGEQGTEAWFQAGDAGRVHFLVISGYPGTPEQLAGGALAPIRSALSLKAWCINTGPLAGDVLERVEGKATVTHRLISQAYRDASPDLNYPERCV